MKFCLLPRSPVADGRREAAQREPANPGQRWILHRNTLVRTLGWEEGMVGGTGSGGRGERWRQGGVGVTHSVFVI